ncbi:MAG: phosphotransferase family protein [Deltaproteobacteria bacterium]|nr:phosphotransferase family protein [Deltaproteobacteria bacterium]MCB9786601.1 phosphotransferase family protein [Deltaproteobacteria bacterium]
MPESATPEALALRVEQALREQAAPELRVTRLAPLIGGACQDNVALDVELDGERLALVLRGDSPSSLPGSLGRRAEFAVVARAAQAGVETPAPRWLVRDALRDGADAWCMPRLEGSAIGRVVTSDPTLAEARADLPGRLAANLARIHSITPQHDGDLPLPDLEAIRERGAAAFATAFVRDMLRGLPEPRPALHLALRWLERHIPDERELVLVHGDFRVGNFLVAPSGLAGILDWEFAHWGSPWDDLAWITVRDWRFGRLDRPVGGFARRAELYRAYERVSGRRVDAATLHWWEVLGNARWAAAAAWQGERYLSGEVPDFELVAIGRRAAEMEWEALRLIETGPTWAGWREEG